MKRNYKIVDSFNSTITNVILNNPPFWLIIIYTFTIGLLVAHYIQKYKQNKN